MRNLSVSKIEKWLLCPLSMKYAYIDRIPQQSVWKLVAGKVVHSVLEQSIREHAKTGAYLDAKTMDDMYEPTWDAMVKEEEEKDTFIGWQDTPDDPVEKMRKEYRPLVTIARNEVLPTLQPFMLNGQPVVEWRIDLTLRSRVGDFPILGFADLLSSDGVLMDWKTTDKEVTARAKKTWLQFAAYSLWAYPIVGEEELRCEKIFLVRGEWAPRVERVPFTVGLKHRKFFVNLAAKVWESIHHGLFIPNYDTWACSPGFCSYWAGCMGELQKKEADLCHKPAPSPIA
jgi:hypothetical protein